MPDAPIPQTPPLLPPQAGRPPLPPLLRPAPPRRRDPRWLAPVVVAAVITTLVGSLLLVTGIIKASGAYTGALARIEASPGAAAALGAPVHASRWVLGNVTTTRDSGRANLTFSVSGPLGSANVWVVAAKSGGTWHFDRLWVRPKAPGLPLDLSDGAVDVPTPTPAAHPEAEGPTY